VHWHRNAARTSVQPEEWDDIILVNIKFLAYNSLERTIHCRIIMQYLKLYLSILTQYTVVFTSAHQSSISDPYVCMNNPLQVKWIRSHRTTLYMAKGQLVKGLICKNPESLIKLEVG
jgi:hypothetical protein